MPEVKYVFRTLARAAGYPVEFRWADAGGESPDVYYGPTPGRSGARLDIPWCGKSLACVSDLDPVEVREDRGVLFLQFAGDSAPEERSSGVLPADLVSGAYWLLTGAGETRYPRDRRDNLDLRGSAFHRLRLMDRPVVSEYAALLVRTFVPLGREPAPPIHGAGREAAFAFTHDVDYPEIIRWIECLRHPAAARRIADGTVHFWRFADWMELARACGTEPAFYFMAVSGSLPRYLLGRPDAFYDIRRARYRSLFRELRDGGAEVGLHASWLAYESGARLASEKELLESSAGGRVWGGRHHYWHLDPRNPNETLLRHERAGLDYDSSLAFEFHPGFRRGMCHPFRPFHPGRRREIDVVQLPPTWMDDHFHRRREQNGIAEPDAHARRLLDRVRAVGGVAVVDYHVRGMEADLFPAYGPWLRSFLESCPTSTLAFHRPEALVRAYRERERALDAASRDQTETPPGLAVLAPGPGEIEIGPMREDEVDATARFHYEFFGIGDIHGRSLAKLGPEALAGLFYRPALNNPRLFVDLARHQGRIVGFNVYCIDRDRVFRDSLRREWPAMIRTAVLAVLRRPGAFMSLLGNLRYVGGESVPTALAADDGKAWHFLEGVLPRYRSREFVEATGHRIAADLVRFMETVLVERGCPAWYGAVRHDNIPMNRFLQHCGAVEVGTARAQGQLLRYYLRTLDETSRDAAVATTGHHG